MIAAGRRIRLYPVFLSLFLFTATAVVIVGIERSLHDAGNINTDPRNGPVEVVVNDHYVATKYCDGTTLIYKAENVAVVPNSPECASRLGSR